MSTASATEIAQWQETMSRVASCLRGGFKNAHPFQDDGEVSPTVIALRDAFHAFPVSADVLLVDAGSVQSPSHYATIFLPPHTSTGPIWTLIAHHIDELPKREVNFHGTVALSGFSSYLPVLSESFGLDERYQEDLTTLRFSGCRTLDGSEVVHFVPYDIRERPDDYARFLGHELFMFCSDALIRRFERKVDFNALYDLPPDPIFSIDEWTRIDDRTSCIVPLESDEPPSFEERQAEVSGIQLIPKVPKDVDVTFRRAKDAYICGYFRYDLFTVAVHYASLALEAAIKARWSANLPQSVGITCGKENIQVQFPSHSKIAHMCGEKRWRGRNVLVDGRQFPWSCRAILDWLEREKIVTKWERQCLTVGLQMRNALSHVEHSSTDTPSSETLRETAMLINKLFQSLP